MSANRDELRTFWDELACSLEEVNWGSIKALLAPQAVDGGTP